MRRFWLHQYHSSFPTLQICTASPGCNILPSILLLLFYWRIRWIAVGFCSFSEKIFKKRNRGKAASPGCNVLPSILLLFSWRLWWIAVGFCSCSENIKKKESGKSNTEKHKDITAFLQRHNIMAITATPFEMSRPWAVSRSAPIWWWWLWWWRLCWL